MVKIASITKAINQVLLNAVFQLWIKPVNTSPMNKLSNNPIASGVILSLTV
jgi:hypothetical protein